MTEPDHGTALRVSDTLAIPLARTISMPEHLDFPTGALHFRLTDLELHLSGTPEGTTLPPFDVTARYMVEATQDDISTHDAGGDLSELPASATAPGGQYQPTDDEREEWLDLARDHQTRLSNINNPNSTKMLATFDKHNETYAQLFDSSKSGFVGLVWKPSMAPNTTAQMCRDTHGSVRDNLSINPPEDQRKYLNARGREVSYNAVSWERYSGVLSWLPVLDEKFVPGRPETVSDEITDAISAAVLFGSNISSKTGNNSNNVHETTRDGVYHLVETATPINDEIARVRTKAVLNPFSDDVWEGWDEDERDLIREHHRAALRWRAARITQAQPTALFTGRCTARVANAAVSTVGKWVEVAMPPLNLTIDDSAWSGAAADVARARLGDLGFLADLVRDAIRERLRRAAVEGDPRVGGSLDR